MDDCATPPLSMESSIGSMDASGARIRVQATGVGAPSGFSTVTIASPIPRPCSTSDRS